MFNRQVYMRPDGTLTDIPTGKTEKPPVSQLDFLSLVDKESFDRMAKEDNGILFNQAVTETGTE